MNCAACRKDTSQLPSVLCFRNSCPFLWRDGGESASFTLSSLSFITGARQDSVCVILGFPRIAGGFQEGLRLDPSASWELKPCFFLCLINSSLVDETECRGRFQYLKLGKVRPTVYTGLAGLSGSEPAWLHAVSQEGRAGRPPFVGLLPRSGLPGAGNLPRTGTDANGVLGSATQAEAGTLCFSPQLVELVAGGWWQPAD